MKPFVGSVLQRAFEGRTRAPSSEMLAMLRGQFPKLGRGSQALVIRLHQLSGSTPQDRADLFDAGSRVGINALAFEEANRFASQTIAERLSTCSTPMATLESLMARDYPDGWSIAVPRAIGHWLGRHPEQLSAAWPALLGPAARIGAGIVAVGEAVGSGGGPAVA